MGIDIEAGPLAGPPQDGISMVSYSIPHVSKAVLVANHCWPSPGSTSIHGKSLLGYPMGSPGSRVVEWTFAFGSSSMSSLRTLLIGRVYRYRLTGVNG